MWPFLKLLKFKKLFIWGDGGNRKSQDLSIVVTICLRLIAALLLQMSLNEDLPDMDGTELLGLLFHDGEDGSTEPLFPDETGLIESWLSEQDVRLHSQKINIYFSY